MRRSGSDLKMVTLRTIPGLERCAERELLDLSRACDEITAKAGEVLVTEGRPGRQAWVVLQGRAEVRRVGTLLWTAGAGQLIGDLGVLGTLPAAATITADGPMELLSLDHRAAEVIFGNPTLARWAFAQGDRRLRELTCAPTQYERTAIPAATVPVPLPTGALVATS
jgi:CRP-like cAMP-binding protein